MRDLYLGELLEGECYATFDEKIIYIDKKHSNYCVVYETYRSQDDWRWCLRTIHYLQTHIKTIMEVM